MPARNSLWRPGQAGNALGCGPSLDGFDTRRSPQFAGIFQWQENRLVSDERRFDPILPAPIQATRSPARTPSSDLGKRGPAPRSPTNRGGFVQRPGRGALTSFTLVRVGHPLPFRRYRLLAGRSALNRERAGSNPPSATNRRRGGIGRPSPLKPGRAQRAGSMPAAGTTSCLRHRAW